MNQPQLDFDPPATPEFGGDTYNAKKDGTRLQHQLASVRRLMGDGVWRSLHEISAATHAPEASVSARLRDLRKPKFGGLQVERQRRTTGTWEYRIEIDCGRL